MRYDGAQAATLKLFWDARMCVQKANTKHSHHGCVFPCELLAALL